LLRIDCDRPRFAEGDAGLLRQCRFRPHTQADDRQLCLDLSSLGLDGREPPALAFEPSNCGRETKRYAVAVQLAPHQLGDLLLGAAHHAVKLLDDGDMQAPPSQRRTSRRAGPQRRRVDEAAAGPDYFSSGVDSANPFRSWPTQSITTQSPA